MKKSVLIFWTLSLIFASKWNHVKGSEVKCLFGGTDNNRHQTAHWSYGQAHKSKRLGTTGSVFLLCDLLLESICQIKAVR